jgi:hypothetical protein
MYVEIRPQAAKRAHNPYVHACTCWFIHENNQFCYVSLQVFTVAVFIPWPSGLQHCVLLWVNIDVSA